MQGPEKDLRRQLESRGKIVKEGIEWQLKLRVRKPPVREKSEKM